MTTFTLYITVENTPAGLELAAFPLLEDQFIDGETPLDGNRTLVEVHLADRTDTDTKQEQYLNTNPHVISYEVRSWKSGSGIC